MYRRKAPVKGVLLCLLAAIMLAAIMFSSGCASTSTARLEQLRDGTAYLQRQSVSLDEELATLQQAVSESQAILATPGIDAGVFGQAQSIMNQALVAIQAGQGKKALVDQQLSKFQADITAIIEKAGGSADIGDEANAIAAGMRNTAPFLPPPFDAILLLVSTGVAAGGTIWSRINKARREAALAIAAEKEAEAAQARTVATDLVLSVQQLRKRLPKTAEDPPLTKDQADEILSHQEPATKIAVTEIKATAKV